jgi:hypothetical protein
MIDIYAIAYFLSPLQVGQKLIRGNSTLDRLFRLQKRELMHETQLKTLNNQKL